MSKIFFQLLRHELHVFRYNFISKFIDTSTVMATNVLVFAYLMPSLGLANTYGAFIFAGAFASFGFFDIVVRTTDMLADITGDKTIAHRLTIPLPTWLSIAAIPVGWSLTSIIMSIAMLPVGKLLLPTILSFNEISFFPFFAILILANLFYGFFGVWIAGVISRMERVGIIWCRIIIPLWMFGAYFFTWQVVYDLSPILGYIACIDPFTFIMEGMRAAFLGQEGFLPVWISILALLGFVLFFGWDAIRRIKKRLDCV